jgi:hypothetical protein
MRRCNHCGGTVYLDEDHLRRCLACSRLVHPRTLADVTGATLPLEMVQAKPRFARVTKPCRRCGNEFEGIAIAKYCGDDCRAAGALDQRAKVRPL